MTTTTTERGVCDGCGGRGQIATGVQCPVCEGSGVASAADLAAWRQSVVDQALSSVRRQLAGTGAAAVTDWLREGAQARQEAQQAARRATLAAEQAQAHAQAPHVEAQAVLAQARAVLARAEAIAQAAMPAALPPGTPAAFIPPDPTDPPPGAPIPPGFGAGDIFYFDSILARQVDVWGALNSLGGSTGFANPMTAAGDLITGGAAGIAQRLAAGAAASLLAVNSSGALAWLPAVANALAFGADPTGVADSTAAINAAYNSLPLAGSPGRGGVVYLPAGTYKTSSTLQFNAVAPVYLRGDGTQLTTIKYTGSGDCVSMYNNYVPSGGSSSILVWGGGVSDMTIDLSGAAAGSVALHCGDMKYGYFARLNLANANGAGSIGLWQDNRKFWTEDCKFEAHLLNCTTGVVIDVSGAAGGAGDVHDNCIFEFSFAGPANGNGVVLQGGANCYNSAFFLHGGIQSSSVAPSSQNYFLTVTGHDPAGTPLSQMNHCELIMKFESDGGLAFTPALILSAAAGNDLGDCHGHISFTVGNGTPSSVAGKFNFTGPIQGDSSLLSTPSGVPANGTQFTNNNPPVIMCVSGGTVSAVKINSVTTGLTSGAFYIAPAATYEIDWTVAPTVNWITAAPH